MGCCGQRRQAYKAWLAPRPVRLRFVGTGTAEAKGVTTGKMYVVSESAPEVEVDGRDAREMVQSGLFVVER
ncbi:MAG TPA: hypothetical protein VG225_11035 [Terracidiphilus sp.]|nr:hypothetical protein [Terracidiphilus sp.]